MEELFFYEITPLGQQSASQIEREYGAEMAKKLEKHVNDLKEFDTEELVKWSKQLMGQED